MAIISLHLLYIKIMDSLKIGTSLTIYYVVLSNQALSLILLPIFLYYREIILVLYPSHIRNTLKLVKLVPGLVLTYVLLIGEYTSLCLAGVRDYDNQYYRELFKNVLDVYFPIIILLQISSHLCNHSYIWNLKYSNSKHSIYITHCQLG